MEKKNLLLAFVMREKNRRIERVQKPRYQINGKSNLDIELIRTSWLYAEEEEEKAN